jgi:hypothetical protein
MVTIMTKRICKNLKIFLFLLILFLIVLYCGRRYYYQRLVEISPVVTVSSLNSCDASLYGYRLFRITGRGKSDFILTLYLKDGLSPDQHYYFKKQKPSYSYFDGVWKSDFFIFCTEQHYLFISDRPKIKESQLQYVNHNVKREHKQNNYIRWIVSPIGNDLETKRVHTDVSCSIITGIDSNNMQRYQIMTGIRLGSYAP